MRQENDAARRFASRRAAAVEYAEAACKTSHADGAARRPVVVAPWRRAPVFGAYSAKRFGLTLLAVLPLAAFAGTPAEIAPCAFVYALAVVAGAEAERSRTKSRRTGVAWAISAGAIVRHDVNPERVVSTTTFLVNALPPLVMVERRDQYARVTFTIRGVMWGERKLVLEGLSCDRDLAEALRPFPKTVRITRTATVDSHGLDEAWVS